MGWNRFLQSCSSHPCSCLPLDRSPSPESLPAAGPPPSEHSLQAGHRRRARGRNAAACPPELVAGAPPSARQLPERYPHEGAAPGQREGAATGMLEVFLGFLLLSVGNGMGRDC